MLFVKFSQFIIALSYCRLNKLPLEHSWSTAQVSVFVFCMWSLSIYTRTLPRTLCNFPNSLVKSNRSLAVTLSLFSLLLVSFLTLALENVVCKRVTLLSINLVFSIQSRISSIVFYRLALSCFSNPIVQKNKKNSYCGYKFRMLLQCIPALSVVSVFEIMNGYHTLLLLRDENLWNNWFD